MCPVKKQMLLVALFFTFSVFYVFTVFNQDTKTDCGNVNKNDKGSASISSNSKKMCFICSVSMSELHVGSKQAKALQFKILCYRKRSTPPSIWWCNINNNGQTNGINMCVVGT